MAMFYGFDEVDFSLTQVEKVLRCDLSGWQRALYKKIQESGAFGIAHDQVCLRIRPQKAFILCFSI